MKKAFFVIDQPECCAECPMHFNAERMHIGDFTYKQLFRCKIEPEGIEDCYLQDILHKKPDWCPLKSVENVHIEKQTKENNIMDRMEELRKTEALEKNKGY